MGKVSPNAWEDRSQAERSFWNANAESSGNLEPGEIDFSFLLQNPWLQEAFTLLGDIAGQRLLDCGAGEGVTSVYLAQKGAWVFAFDISEKSLAKLCRYSEGKANPVSAVASSFEHLPFPDNSLDLAFGAYILHHVNIMEAGRELYRVLRPGGRAVFVETWRGNVLLDWARRHLAGRWGVARYGTTTECPLTYSDLGLLKTLFTVDLYFTECVLFSKACANIFRWQRKWRLVTRTLCWIDRQLSHSAFFRQRGYYCILRLQKLLD
jgi:SAM-dependent methyltransferase